MEKKQPTPTKPVNYGLEFAQVRERPTTRAVVLKRKDNPGQVIRHVLKCGGKGNFSWKCSDPEDKDKTEAKNSKYQTTR